MMRTVRRLSLMLLALISMQSLAQDGGRGGRGNFDPAQMQERMLSFQKEQLAIADEEWEAIKPLMVAVMEKQRDARELQNRGFGRNRGGDRTQAPEVEALTKALEGDDTAAIKTAMEALRAARAARQAEVKKAQDALREVLTLQQEAKLVSAGFLE